MSAQGGEQVHPFGPHVLVTKPSDDDVRAKRLGMWLPASTNRLQRGVVVEVGDCGMMHYEEMPLQPGYVVLYHAQGMIMLDTDDTILVPVAAIVAYEV